MLSYVLSESPHLPALGLVCDDLTRSTTWATGSTRQSEVANTRNGAFDSSTLKRFLCGSVGFPQASWPTIHFIGFTEPTSTIL